MLEVIPFPKNGIRIAKKINGISISARLKRVKIETFAAIVEARTRAKKAINAGHTVIGVETTTKIKRSTVTIFKCEGSECTIEWR